MGIFLLQMIGIGTPEAEIKHSDNKFISPLGKDNKSWGLSYTGLFHHCGVRQRYGPSFGQGSVIGVHVDLWKGTLSFYKDRKHLGELIYPNFIMLNFHRRYVFFI